MKLKGKSGQQYELELIPFAQGGEGEIYNIVGRNDMVAKIYKQGKNTPERESKLLRMVEFPPDSSSLSQIAWPTEVLYLTDVFAGFIMPKLAINEELNVIYEYGAMAKYANMLWSNRITIAKNLCAVLSSVHAAGHVCGDLNPKNISVNPNNGHVVFVDTDSYHIKDGNDIYRCEVGIPEYLPAEVQNKIKAGETLATALLPTFSEATDNFALAVHIFQLLMNGVHPFACAILPSQSSVVAPQPSDNILKGDFPFLKDVPGVTIPLFAPKIEMLPMEMQELFRKAFVDGHSAPDNRPTTYDWYTALANLEKSLKDCSVVKHHQYNSLLNSCPWCEADEAYQKQMQPKINQTAISGSSGKPVTPAKPVSPAKPVIPTPPPLSNIKNGPNITYKKLSFLKKMAFASVFLICTIVGLMVYIVNLYEDRDDWESRYTAAISNKETMSSQVEGLKGEKEDLSSKYSDIQSKYSQLQKDYSDISSQKDNLQANINSLNTTISALIPNDVSVQVNSVFNGGDSAEFISSELNSSSLKFLTFTYSVYAKDISSYEGGELQISIYKPDGSIFKGSDSPDSCTFTKTITANATTFGWGSASGGAYPPGLYVIQFVYNNKVVGSQTAIVK